MSTDSSNLTYFDSFASLMAASSGWSAVPTFSLTLR